MSGRFLGNHRRELVEFDAEFLILPAGFRALGVDGVPFSGDGHYARDGGAENGEDGAFAGGYGLKCVRGEVLKQVRVQLEALSGLGDDLCEEGEGGSRLYRGRGGGAFLKARGVCPGNGSSLRLIAWGDVRNLYQRTERGVRRREVSCKESGVCVFVECRGGVVVGEELDLNLMPFFVFFFLLFFFTMGSLF